MTGDDDSRNVFRMLSGPSLLTSYVYFHNALEEVWERCHARASRGCVGRK